MAQIHWADFARACAPSMRERGVPAEKIEHWMSRVDEEISGTKARVYHGVISVSGRRLSE
ncbi:hypothetical protein SISNIDRAFT_452796 [Sistotremastrum niveocremeum HHB9708]|uniref:Uncharacterized protein n=1 Tax=Sistotremastrum niveocremeum HHB9708 TaxID=1314777 RepID=A0A164W374_9AGAM|nr:hypothetical protein SISNIDRAFT_452796 [Sistotremastrum niveocremeum HHB9708]